MIERVKQDILARVGHYYFGSDEDTLAARLIKVVIVEVKKSQNPTKKIT